MIFSGKKGFKKFISCFFIEVLTDVKHILMFFIDFILEFLVSFKKRFGFYGIRDVFIGNMWLKCAIRIFSFSFSFLSGSFFGIWLEV